jgi:hypothetical protein
MLGRQRADQVRSQIPRKVGQDRFRVSGSARRRLLAQLNTGNLAAVHSQDFISRSTLRLVEDPQMKRGPNEKECRALALSRRPRPSTSRLRRNVAARLLQVNVSKGSRKVETRGNQKKRHRQGINKSVPIRSGSGSVIPEPFF